MHAGAVPSTDGAHESTSGTAISIDCFDTYKSYYKFNLDYINFYNLVRLNPNQGATDSRAAYNVLRQHTAGHQNAFFNVIDRGLNGANDARDAVQAKRCAERLAATLR